MNFLKSIQRKKHKLDSQYIQYPLSPTSPTSGIKISPVMSDSHQQIANPQPEQKTPSKEKTNPFIALSELKATQQHYQMLKKRMQVLKLKQQKNNNRSQLNHRKIILHGSIQKLAQLQKQRLNQWKQQNQQRVQQQRLNNLQQKLNHHQNLKEIQQSIKQSKLREYQQRKQQSKYHQSRIKQIQQQTVNINKQKVQKIKKLETFSRLSIESYNKQKLHEFREKKFKQTGSLQMRKIQKQQEIKKMLELEMEMIERQSRSRIMFDSSKQTLKQILNPEMRLSSSRVQKSGQNSNSRLNSTDGNILEPALRQNKLLDEDVEKSSDSLTKSSSYKLEGMKNGFSLPEIRASRKFV